MRCNAEKRRGTIAILTAVSLVAILGVVAIALDGGLLLDNRRSVQSAADAAALAAADDLFVQYGNGGTGLDPSGKAQASALATAAANDYNNDGVTSIVTVNIPPTSGLFVGKAGYVEVIIQFNQKREFSSIFGSGDLPVKARAVARGLRGNIGILILDPHLMDACEIDGNVNALNGGQIFSNSDNTVANDSPLTGSVYVAGTSTLSTGGINVRGSLSNSGNITYTNNGGLNYYTNPIPDPLAQIPEPTTDGLTNFGSVTISGNTTLQPGVYTSITINSGTVTLAPGIYYLGGSSGGSGGGGPGGGGPGGGGPKGGGPGGGNNGLYLNGGSLNGTGVMFFDNTGGDNFLNKAYGPVNITPPTSTTGGSWPTGTTSTTYQGISFWIPRSQSKEVHVESAFSLTMPGTWYAQAGEYDIRPDGATTVFNIGNYICDQAEWGQGYSSSQNKSNGIINMNPGTAAPTQRPMLVE